MPPPPEAGPASDSGALDARMSSLLEKRRQRGNLRSLDLPTNYDPSTLVDLSSNDYLSLSRSKQLKDRLKSQLLADLDDGPPSSPSSSSASTSPYGPASSRLLDGNSPSHMQLEARLAKFFEGESALLFNSGFDANAGLFACLPSRGDVIVYDELIHASTHDGMRASRCDVRIPFKHNSPKDLKRVLSDLLIQPQQQQDGSQQFAKKLASGESQVFIAVEALYSMDGDLAPLERFVEIKDKLFPSGNAHLIVDEAHSTGLYGRQGRGLTCALGLQDKVLVRLHTFGKAMACSGGVVLCSPLLRNYLINYARPLIYSTAMPRLLVSAISCAIAHMESGGADQAIDHLHFLARRCNELLRTSLRRLSAPVVSLLDEEEEKDEDRALPKGKHPWTSPIVPIITNQPRLLSAHLISRGYLVRPIAYPTVPKGQERVRTCLHSHNTVEEVEGMVRAIVEWATSSHEGPTEQKKAASVPQQIAQARL